MSSQVASHRKVGPGATDGGRSLRMAAPALLLALLPLALVTHGECGYLMEIAS